MINRLRHEKINSFLYINIMNVKLNSFICTFIVNLNRIDEQINAGMQWDSSMIFNLN